MAGCHHGLNEHEFEQALGCSKAQGGLVCCSPWGHKELDMTKQLNNNKIDRTFYLLFFFFFSTQFFLIIPVQPIHQRKLSNYDFHRPLLEKTLWILSWGQESLSKILWNHKWLRTFVSKIFFFTNLFIFLLFKKGLLIANTLQGIRVCSQMPLNR